MAQMCKLIQAPTIDICFQAPFQVIQILVLYLLGVISGQTPQLEDCNQLQQTKTFKSNTCQSTRQKEYSRLNFCWFATK